MTALGLAYIRGYYGVPATVGARVLFDGKPAVITGTTDAYLLIRIDGQSNSVPVHPTWHMEYPPQGESK